MNKEIINTFTLHSQELGMSWTINFPVFFAKFKEISGVDLQPIVTPLLVRLVKSEIKNLEQNPTMTKQNKLNLENLTNWIKATNHG